MLSLSYDDYVYINFICNKSNVSIFFISLIFECHIRKCTQYVKVL